MSYYNLNDEQIIYTLNNTCYCSFCISHLDNTYCIPMFYRFSYCNNKFTFYLTSFNRGEKEKILSQHNKVSILFVYKSFDIIRTVCVQGICQENDDNNYTDCEKNYYVVKTINISGRCYQGL